ncbi:UTP--glucose-1-phosphate uridylyltransferase [Salinispora tropica]|uniref:UTP--glucose-1-phosphate uridylyltransferase n=1 Tax=Salinispora tropica (strain ATCC BAA-916 / DSM 44818 / JCM 13857 / NBRC 105044 / CNB-440) TaxID=369723 RepID=A4X2X2_SALTO|nr:UTP--glucose-1-phosphate uridylyltransferase [Salinispora tropica]ABP53222.1 UDP-glucose pyrophosphorylase [Salinispora tropica CNB-440]
MSEHSANPSSTATTTGGPRAVKAVIPAAGLATRFLPATKAVPKELLPVVDRPVLQYIVEEATEAGITDVLLITGRGKTSMVDHFDRRPDLEERLAKKPELLAAVKRTEDLAAIYTCRQPEQLGLGHAVGYAESHIGDQPFAVLLGDEFVKPTEPLLPAMLELQARTGGIVLAFFEVDPDETTRYGIASVAPAEAEFADIAEVVRVTGMVEKPEPEEAPSNLAVLGRYVLPGRIFDAIHRTEPGSGGEIQLTDAMEILRTEGVPVHAIVYRGTRYDTGMPLGYLQTVVQIAAERDDLGAEFREWLADFVNAGSSGGPRT